MRYEAMAVIGNELVLSMKIYCTMNKAYYNEKKR